METNGLSVSIRVYPWPCSFPFCFSEPIDCPCFRKLTCPNLKDAPPPGLWRTHTARWNFGTLRLPVEDVARVQRLAARKGLGYQTLVKTLLREALDRAESA